ncbi:MAG: FG-GAP-like repeat-containing protein [Thermogutta sp.]
MTRSFIAARFFLSVTTAMAVVLGVAASLARSETAADKASAFQSLAVFNRGCALLEKYEYSAAADAFRQVLEAQPNWFAAKFNLALAYLNMQEESGGADALNLARDLLLRLVAEKPDSLHAWYALGLYYEHVGEHEKALECFARVHGEDPHDAHAAFKTAEALIVLGRHDEAVTLLEQATAQDPGFVSAVYRLAMLYQRGGQREKAAPLFERFRALNNAELAGGSFTVRKIYGSAGKYYLALGPDDLPLADAEEHGVQPIVFSPEVAELPVEIRAWDWENIRVRTGGAVVGDWDGDGDLDGIVYGVGENAAAQILRNDGTGNFQAGTLFSDHVVSVAAGDVDNDGDVDLWLGRAGRDELWENTGDGQFTRVDALIPNIPEGTFTAAARMIDVDCDGDLDLLSCQLPTAADRGGARLWINNRDGTYREAARELGWNAPGKPLTNVIWADLDGDRDPDAVLLPLQGSPMIWVNDRVGKFRLFDGERTGLRIAGCVAASAGDFDNDGRLDLLVMTGTENRLCRNLGDFRFEEVAAFAAVPGARGGTAAQFADLDNDGDLDLVIGDALRSDGRRGPVALINDLAQGRWLNCEQADGVFLFAALDFAGNAPCVAADPDQDGRLDVLVLPTEGAPKLLKNVTQGGNWVQFDLAGTRYRDQKSRSNESAIGARIEIKSGTITAQQVVGMASGPTTAGPLRLHFGLGNNTEVQWLRIIWPDGVLQAEVGLPADQVHKVAEIPRKTSSCPHLFAWDGEKFAFVSDFGGMGGLGYLVAPDVYAVPDPTEIVPIPELQAKNGRHQIRIVEPLEEVVYLDEIKLLAVDHPADTTVLPHEMMAVNLPPPPFEIFAIREQDRLDPIAARDHEGKDVLTALTKVDRQYAGATRLDPRFCGVALPHGIELDFGPGLQDRIGGPQRLILAANGWVEYGYSQTNFAAFQANVRLEAPSVDVFRDGQWVELLREAAYPAGINHWMTIDLTHLLRPGDSRLRIRSNLELYWDRIFLAAVEIVSPERIHEIPATHAELRYLGFPREYSPDGKGPNLLDYANIDYTLSWKALPGWFTRFGDVRELIASPDDAFVIFGPGEEVAVEFDAHAIPSPPPGYVRSWLLKTDSFCKDMDLYTAAGETLAPLPFHGMSRYPYPPEETYPDTPATHRAREVYNTRRVGPPSVTAH